MIEEKLKEFDKLIDNLPSRVAETPRQVLKDFFIQSYKQLLEEDIKTMEGMLKDEKGQCMKCGGAGGAIIGEHLVSMDMAIDAGDRSLEGTHHSYETEECDVCEGTGIMEIPLEYNDSLRSLIDSKREALNKLKAN